MTGECVTPILPTGPPNGWPNTDVAATTGSAGRHAVPPVHAEATGGTIPPSYAVSRAIEPDRADEQDRGFEAAWLEARGRVMAYCRGMAERPGEADDIFQQVAIRAWRGYATFKGDAPFLSWVLAIARRESLRLLARRGARDGRERSLDAIAETAPGTLPVLTEPSIESSAPPAHWLPEVTRAAIVAGELSEAEGRVIVKRSGDQEATWDAIAAGLSMTASGCAVLHCRAIPKLRVYLFMHHPDLLGGLPAIADAFAVTPLAPIDDLSPEEADVFRRVVLDGQHGYRRVGWRLTLRAACGKMVKRLALP